VKTVDVLVAGGGPAGAATANLLARLGHEVLLCEAREFPRDKICGEYLPPSVRRTLRDLGAADAVDALNPVPLVGMAVVAPGGGRILGRFGSDAGHGLSVRRRDFDAALLATARSARVFVRDVTRLQSLEVSSRTVVATLRPARGEAERVGARVVVGADGRNSLVARHRGLRQGTVRHRRFAVMGHFAGVVVPADHGEMIVTPYGYCGVNPLPGGEANVCLVFDPARLGAGRRSGDHGFLPGRSDLERFWDHTIRSIPATASRLHDARRLGPLRATGPLSCGVTRAADQRVLLVGDAAGFYDPFTGEGVGSALRGACFAAEVLDAALRKNDLSLRALQPYDTRRRAAWSGRARVERLLQAILPRPRLTDWMVGRLSRHPAIADLLAGVTADLRPARALLRPEILSRLLLA
jgi:flavin-dependent dehydrogenase